MPRTPRSPPLPQPLWVFITFVFFVCRNKFIFYFRFFTRDLSHCARLSFLKSDFSLASQLNLLRLFGAHVCTFNEIPWVALLFLVIFPTVLSLFLSRPTTPTCPATPQLLSFPEHNWSELFIYNCKSHATPSAAGGVPRVFEFLAGPFAGYPFKLGSFSFIFSGN